MAFDRARGRTVLVNGSDIWEAAGTTWRLAASGPGGGGINGAFAYDDAREVSVWFGGSAFVAVTNTTFEWDGTTWLQRSPAQSPPARAFTAMAYDSARSRMVLFGGAQFGTTLGDTWEYDGVTWQQPHHPDLAAVDGAARHDV